MASYANLNLNDYAGLTKEDYAQMALSGTDSGSGSGSGSGSDTGTGSGACLWTEALIQSLQSSIANLETKMDSLSSDVAALKAYGDTHWKTANVSALATSSALTSAKDVILANLSTSIGSVPAQVWNFGEDYTSRSVKANGVSLESSELTVNIDSAEIANRVWSNTSRTLTSGENINFPEFKTSDLAKAEQVENVAKVSDLADLAKSADIVQVQEDVINIQNTMEDAFTNEKTL